MGDRSETAFDTWAESKGITKIGWGLNRPPFEYLQYLPAEIRLTPDRLCEDQNNYVRNTYHANIQKHFLVEVKAVGRDQIVKIKHKHLPVMQKIQVFNRRPILFFVFDSDQQRVSLSHSLDDIVRLAPHMEEGSFHDSGPYYKFPTDTFLWEPFAEGTGD